MKISSSLSYASIFVCSIIAYGVIAFNPLTCTIIGVIAYFCFGIITVSSLAATIAIVAVCWPIVLVVGVSLLILIVGLLIESCITGPGIFYKIIAICGQIITDSYNYVISNTMDYSIKFANWLVSDLESVSVSVSVYDPESDSISISISVSVTQSITKSELESESVSESVSESESVLESDSIQKSESKSFICTNSNNMNIEIETDTNFKSTNSEQKSCFDYIYGIYEYMSLTNI